MKKEESKLSSPMHVAETAKDNRLSGEVINMITPIPNTPFTHIENIETGDKFLTLGKHRLTLEPCSLEEAKALTDTVKNWDFLMTVISVVFTHMEENK